jgi:DNA modification methylase
MLVDRLLQCFTNDDDQVVLDPFCGSGSTIVAAVKQGKRGLGVDLSEKFLKIAEERLSQASLLTTYDYALFHEDSRKLVHYIKPNSVDFVCTSPPYWNILNQKRTADYKPIRTYGDDAFDLGNVDDYEEFLNCLQVVFRQVYEVLRHGKYCIVNVMDLRKKAHFYPFHMDIVSHMQRVGFLFDDIIIWDRRAEYNNLRSLGYPSVFRLNKVHEYLLIFQKPDPSVLQRNLSNGDINGTTADDAD